MKSLNYQFFKLLVIFLFRYIYYEFLIFNKLKLKFVINSQQYIVIDIVINIYILQPLKKILKKILKIHIDINTERFIFIKIQIFQYCY